MKTGAKDNLGAFSNKPGLSRKAMPLASPLGINKRKDINSRNDNDSPLQVIDHDLFNSLMHGDRKYHDEDKENERPNRGRDAGKSRTRQDVDRLRYLEEELFAERNKSEILEEEIKQLEEHAISEEAKYKQKLEQFSQQIKKFNNLQQEVIKGRDESMARAAEVESLHQEVESLHQEISKYKEAARNALEFVIKSFEIASLLPDHVEVNTTSHEQVDFSFDEKKATYIPKTIFLQNKILKYLEMNEQLLMDFKLDAQIFKIIEEYNKKKPNLSTQPESTTKKSAGQSPSRSKSRRKSSPKVKGGKLSGKKADSFADRSMQESMSECVPDRANTSLSRSFQSNSGGKSNNYSININLVVNDNSDSAISEQNQSQSMQIGGNPPRQDIQNFIQYFEKTLGCSRNMSESSINPGDSLLYSPSDKSNPPAYSSNGAKPKKHIQDEYQGNSVPAAATQKVKGSHNVEESSQASKHSVAIAIYDYQTDDPRDMTFTKGDKISITRTLGHGWLEGINLSTRQKGLVPGNFVTMIWGGAVTLANN